MRVWTTHSMLADTQVDKGALSSSGKVGGNVLEKEEVLQRESEQLLLPFLRDTAMAVQVGLSWRSKG